MNLYKIDPYIVGILFKLKEQTAVDNEFNNIMSTINELTEVTVKNFLKENGVDEAQIQLVIGAKDNQPQLAEKTTLLLNSPELTKSLDQVLNTFYKFLYDQTVPQLSADELKALNDYVALSQEADKQEEKFIAGISDVVNLAVKKSGLTLDQLMADTQQPAVPMTAQVAASPAPAIQAPVFQPQSGIPPVHLGGSLSKQQPMPQQGGNPVVPTA